MIGNVEFRLSILSMKYIFKEFTEILDCIADEINNLEQISPV
jgi:hypothetical protein